MTEMSREQGSAAPAAGRWVKVWDLPTRLFHWLLVCLVVVGVVTGFVTPEWWMGVHVWAGYGLVALMAFGSSGASVDLSIAASSAFSTHRAAPSNISRACCYCGRHITWGITQPGR